ncbi:hypothetical protein [Rhizobium leguminosarum]|uniref:hypothetical protein n=1 Tax=Rhizobium leguminosarum TaxID=384 RepID=UPI0013B63BAA|nr:hypothetical protein [Rhizobium leguminosarum]MBY3180074.1 hypothetical protein [Rhizobium leguminosarum]NEI67447.1 hypothetical protein [Rhizobium leguminosarum]
MSFRKACTRSYIQPFSRIVPLDVESAQGLGWQLTGGVVGAIEPMTATSRLISSG